jgi:hypothetical protein
MRKILIIELLLILSFTNALAQNNAGFKEQDLTVIIQDPAQNPLLQGKDNVVAEVKAAVDSIITNKKLSSLMFDDEQNDDIERAIESLRLDPETRAKKFAGLKPGEQKIIKRKEENEKAYIYLGSIIYLNAQNWVVWINNQKITSLSNKKDDEIYLKNVQKDKAKLLWQLSVSKWKILSGYSSEDAPPEVSADNKVQIEFELKPNQTFILSSKRVVEGKIAPLIVEVDSDTATEVAPESVILDTTPIAPPETPLAQ